MALIVKRLTRTEGNKQGDRCKICDTDIGSSNTSLSMF